jgi:hypothetical protein
VIDSQTLGDGSRFIRIEGVLPALPTIPETTPVAPSVRQHSARLQPISSGGNSPAISRWRPCTCVELSLQTAMQN